jgi:hypothetical protein
MQNQLQNLAVLSACAAREVSQLLGDCQKKAIEFQYASARPIERRNEPLFGTAKYGNASFKDGARSKPRITFDPPVVRRYYLVNKGIILTSDGNLCKIDSHPRTFSFSKYLSLRHLRPL